MTRRSNPLLHMAVMLLAVVLPGAYGDDQSNETEDVKVRGLVLKMPTTWKQQEPLSRLRLAQFSLPAVKGDKEPAELAIFSFGGGGDVENNVKRWIEQFQPEGRKVKVTSGRSAQGLYVLVELAGTYKKPDGPPVQRKTIDAPGYRVLAVILAVEQKGNYFLKMVGPDKTVAANAEALRSSFGAKGEDEKELKLEE